MLSLHCVLGEGNSDSRKSVFSGSEYFFLCGEEDAMKHTEAASDRVREWYVGKKSHSRLSAFAQRSLCERQHR